MVRFYIFGSLVSILVAKFFEKRHPVAAFLSTVAIFSVGGIDWTTRVDALQRQALTQALLWMQIDRVATNAGVATSAATS